MCQLRTDLRHNFDCCSGSSDSTHEGQSIQPEFAVQFFWNGAFTDSEDDQNTEYELWNGSTL